MGFSLVVGYGPAGAGTARLLAEAGQSVRVVSRSPRPPENGIEHVTADAADTGRLAAAAAGAAAIYNCACPPYPRWTRDWPPLAASVNAAAESSGAVLVVLSNLYGYGPVTSAMSEGLPLAASGPKGRVRASVFAQTMALHEAGRIRAVEARASDFFGPGVVDGGHLGARVIPRVLRGRAVQTLGDPDASHSWTYLPDVSRALVRLAGQEEAWGRAWHVPTVPARSVRAMVALIAERAGVPPVPVRRTPAALLRLVAAFSPMMRELQEVRYQFDRPFVVDTSAYTARFDELPTPVEEQVSVTVDWWRQRIARS